MKLVLVFALTLISLLGFSQDEMGQGVDTTAQDEAAIEELQNSQENRQKKLETITHIVGAEEKPETDLVQPGTNQMRPGALFDKAALEEMERTLISANLSKVPADELKKKVIELFKGSFAEGYVQKSPKLQDFMVDLLRDEKALLYAIRIFKDRARLKIYLYCWIGIMFAAYYTKRLFISKYWTGLNRTFAALLFSLTISTITLSTFCLIFEEEMKPIIGLVRKHL